MLVMKVEIYFITDTRERTREREREFLDVKLIFCLIFKYKRN